MDMIKTFKEKLYISTILTIPIIILSPTIQKNFGFSLKFSGDNIVVFLLATFIFFYGGSPFLIGFYKEIKKHSPGMMTLIALAISVAYLYSSSVIFLISGKTFFWELATLIDIMLFGHIIEMKATIKATFNIEELIKLLPSKAHLILANESIKEVEVKDLKENDKVLIKPGEKIPVDGKITKGQSEINEALVTGESKPKLKKENDKIIGGSINTTGSIEVEVKQTGDKTYISQVIKLVKESLQSKSKTQNLADKFAKFLTIIAVFVGLLTIIIWVILSKDFPFALERMVTVMVITCPHALGLAIPLVASITTTISARNGLLIKNKTAFEKSRKTTTVLFDKTGTLTKGKFEIDKIISTSNWSEKEVLQNAASLEKQSEHSIAIGVVEHAKKENLDLLPIKNFKAIPGKGAKADINNQTVFVGNEYLLEEINLNGNKIEKIKKEAQTFIFVSTNDEVKGIITLSDQIRDESIIACKKLQKMGIKIAMITGDNEEVAQKTAKQLNIKTIFSNVLPHQKSEKVKILQQKNEIVAMVGDGINDAPALAQADIGIAIGSGTQIAAQTSDIILVKNDPTNIVDLINLAQITYRKMVQNLVWASGYNIFGIPLAAGVLYKFGILLNPAMAAIAMSLSTVIVAINSKFLKFKSFKFHIEKNTEENEPKCH